jgi:IS66 Orf2 like protein
MIQVMPGTKVYLACRPVSMRYGFDGLAAQVKQVLAADPFICVERYYVAASLLDDCFWGCAQVQPPHNQRASSNRSTASFGRY